MSSNEKKRARGVMNVWLVLVITGVVILAVWLTQRSPGARLAPESLTAVSPGNSFKVLYVDSYHPTYPPNAAMHQGVEDVLLPKKVELKYTYMDAKHKKSPEEQRAAALRVKGEIESWQPDILIAADDSASRYLIQPYYKDAQLPVVFIGVNWDSQQYGFPYSNVTGQVEVEMVNQLIMTLKEFSKGNRVGLLSGKTLTDQNTLNHYRNTLGLKFDQVSLVNSYQEWQEAYIAMQKTVDCIIMRNNAGISGWDDADVSTFVQRETRVPTGTVSSHLGRIVLVSYAKSNYEFGEYGGRIAWRILNGEPPSSIPITENRQTRIILNMKLAKTLGVRFPLDLIQSATLISADFRKVLLVNSYYPGFKWSDDIEKGVLQALGIKRDPDGSLDTTASNVNLKIVYMNTKKERLESEIKKVARSIKNTIDNWKPEVVITCDDNAAKYLVEPYMKDSNIPIVFCGVNWDAAVYGFPYKNMTGIVEVTPVMETVDLLKTYAKGERIGIVGTDNISSLKESTYLKGILKINDADIWLFKTFSAFKAEYDELQSSVDMLLMVNPASMSGWIDQDAMAFINEHTRIPTGCTSDNDAQYALLGKVKIAEEQGWWAGNAALKILSGVDPSDILVTTNKSSKLILNMTLAKAMTIKFPMDLVQGASLISHENPDLK